MIGAKPGKEFKDRLSEAGLYSSIPQIDFFLEEGKTTYGFGYPIKALEKFLGYYDPEMHLPYNPSISFNTDFSLCQCLCEYKDQYSSDEVVLDGRVSEEYSLRAGKALDLFRGLTKLNGHFRFIIERKRRYERAKGLSESAAVASAVSRALLRNVSQSEPDERVVSRFAKFVSGSGTRSAISGFSIWVSYPGIREEESFAVKLPVNYSRFKFAAIPLYTDIKTSDMHRLVVDSPIYETWISTKYLRLNEIMDNGFLLSDLMDRGFEEMVSLSNLIKSVGKEIHTADTLTIIEKFLEFRRRNEGIYMTTDTGPSAVIMSEDDSLLQDFLSVLPYEHLNGKVMDSVDPDSKQTFMKENMEKYGL